MTPDEEMRRGEAAARIVNDELFKDSKAKLFERLAQLRRDVPIHETAMHSRLILMEQLALSFFRDFEYTIQTGKLAQAKWIQDEQQRSLRERAVAVFGRIGRNSI